MWNKTELENAIATIEAKLASQGRVTDARMSDHLDNLKAILKTLN